MKTVGLRSCGRSLDLSDSALGPLVSSDSDDSVPNLQQFMERDGYLYFQDFLDTDVVSEARSTILDSLSEKGVLDASAPVRDGVVKDDYTSDFQSEDERFPKVRELVEGQSTKQFFDRFLEGESRSLDHIWLRMKSPGRATAPHCDIVYMGRGTKHLYTIWMPLGDVPLEMGPLMVLEGSHRSKTLLNKYCKMDADRGNKAFNWHFRHGGFFRGGQYTKNPVAAQRELGGRWLTTDFALGDLMIFSTYTLHGSLDNRSNQIRLSADARYQLASEPADPRWVKS